jgi:hypothetical protein
MNCLHTQAVVQRVLVRLGAVALVVGALAVFLTLASGAVAGQEVDITVQPEDAEVEPDGQLTVEVVVEGAGNGIGAHDIEVSLADGDVAEITDVAFVKEPLPLQTESGVRNNGTTAVGVAAMGDNTYGGGGDTAVLELTVEGKRLNESTELTVVEGSAVAGPGGSQYSVGSFGSATVSVVENPSNDGGGDGLGPGFGILAALAALAGAGSLRYAVGRR